MLNAKYESIIGLLLLVLAKVYLGDFSFKLLACFSSLSLLIALYWILAVEKFKSFNTNVEKLFDWSFIKLNFSKKLLNERVGLSPEIWFLRLASVQFPILY